MSRNVGAMWSFRRTPVINRAAGAMLCCLQSLNDRVGDPIQDSVAVVDATCDEYVDKSVQGDGWWRLSN